MPKIDAKKYFVEKPAYEVVADVPVKGRSDPGSMTLMSNNLIPGVNMYIEGGWVLDMPDPNPHIHEHTHNFDEIVLHIGGDSNNPEELGGEITFYLDGQPLTLTKTCAIFVPKGVKHGPLVWKNVTGPHLELTVIPGAGSLAEADPGGHQAKIKGGK